jgi:hypothetical protein
MEAISDDEQKLKINNLEKKVAVLTQELRNRPVVSIEKARSQQMGKFWVLSVAISVFWIIVCIQKGQITLALANFILAFLPLWRHLYVDTPFYMRTVAWVIVAGTCALMLRAAEH